MYRVLNSGKYNVKEFLASCFPEKGEKYHFAKYQCCSPRQYNNIENISLGNEQNVQLIIHPKSKTSKAHFIAGNGDESRYGTNVEFNIIDKFIEIEDFAGYRCCVGYVILQEL